MSAKQSKYIVRCPRCHKDHSNTINTEKLDALIKEGSPDASLVCCGGDTLLKRLVPLDLNNPEHVRLRKQVKTKW